MQKIIFEVFSPNSQPHISNQLHLLFTSLPSESFYLVLNFSFIRKTSSSSCKGLTTPELLAWLRIHQAKNEKSGCPSVVSQCAPSLFPFHQQPSQLDHQDQSPPSSQLPPVLPLSSRPVFYPFYPREGTNMARRNTSQRRHLPRLRPRRSRRSVICSENHYLQVLLSMLGISSSMLQRAMCKESLKKLARWHRLESSKMAEAWAKGDFPLLVSFFSFLFLSFILFWSPKLTKTHTDSATSNSKTKPRPTALSKCSTSNFLKAVVWT